MKLILAILGLCVCGISTYDDELWMTLMSANIMRALSKEMTGEGKDTHTLAGDLRLTTLVELVKKADLAGALSGAGTVTAVVSKCPAFTYLLKAVKFAGLAGLLDGKGPYTVFAPSDNAFKKIPSKCLDKLLSDKDLLIAVPKYHVVPSTLYSAGLSCGDKLKTANGQDVKITEMFGSVYVNWSKVTYADATVTNGVMHVIDNVLFQEMGLTECENDARFDRKDGSNSEVYKHFLNL